MNTLVALKNVKVYLCFITQQNQQKMLNIKIDLFYFYKNEILTLEMLVILITPKITQLIIQLIKRILQRLIINCNSRPTIS